MALLLGLAACTSAHIAPIGQNSFQPEEDEARLWKESRELQMRFDRSGLIYEDGLVAAYVNQVAFKLIPVSVAKEIKINVKILKHPTPNAFALPHGALYIHTGMLAQMKNEAQLAAVIGHEVTHITHRHTLQSFRTTKQAAAFGSTLAVIGAPAGVYGLGVVLLGSLGALAAVSGYSQSLEEDADTDGLRLMVTAGYDPADAVKVFANLKRYVEIAEIKEPFFFSTHPRLEERIASYQRLLDTEYKGRTGRQAKGDFMSAVAPVILENAFFEMAAGRYTLAQESIENCLGREPANSQAHFALAELLRQRGLEEDQARAEKEYYTAIDLNPRFAAPHRGVGLIYFKSKRIDLAREHFEKYLELNPAAKDRAYIEQYLGEISTGGPTR